MKHYWAKLHYIIILPTWPFPITTCPYGWYCVIITAVQISSLYFEMFLNSTILFTLSVLHNLSTIFRLLSTFSPPLLSAVCLNLGLESLVSLSAMGLLFLNFTGIWFIFYYCRIEKLFFNSNKLSINKKKLSFASNISNMAIFIIK